MNYFSFRKITIPFCVFITGACVLIIEITATRVLSPYFGNTIFSISSVISVVLAALSLGYYVGGRMADKYPREELFYGIIALSGFCVVALHWLGMIFLSTFGYGLSMIEGPIIASILLFFLQSFLLGMLSPFAIKLQAMRLEQAGIGSVSGEIFFWSTLGSILGSLGAGFFLIPHLGINNITFGVGFLLMAMGLVSLVKIKTWTILFLAAVFLIFVSYFKEPFDTPGALYSRDALYQKITIYDGQHMGRPARFLMQDRNSSAAALINSDALAYEYTKYYALYQIFNPDIKEAFMIGGGAYSVPKALLSDLPGATIDVAEIEPSLFTLSQQYFNVPDEARLRNFVEDGRRFLADSQKKYDLIFSDAYSSIYSTPSHLTTLEFFTLAKNKLSGRGLFIANVIGSLSDKKSTSLALSEIKTFKTVFPNSYFFAVVSPQSTDLQNIIFIGYNGANLIDVDSPEIRGNKNPIISGLAQKEIDVSKLDFSLYPVLTDDYSPVEYLTFKALES